MMVLIYIYIMMAHNIKIYIFFIWNIWWQNTDKLQVMSCCKNYLFEKFVPIPQCLWIPLIELSYPPPISPYRYIRRITGVKTRGRQQLWIILWNWGVYYYLYCIKLCIGELFWRYFVFGGLELWHLWWDFRLKVSFI